MSERRRPTPKGLLEKLSAAQTKQLAKLIDAYLARTPTGGKTLTDVRAELKEVVVSWRRRAASPPARPRAAGCRIARR